MKLTHLMYIAWGNWILYPFAYFAAWVYDAPIQLAISTLAYIWFAVSPMFACFLIREAYLLGEVRAAILKATGETI